MCSTPRTGTTSAAARPRAAGDDICNGAIDNATGTAALVALAEATRQGRPGAAVSCSWR
jgi:Zn-dependent M28 family amino/carboxypeptidase